MTPLYLETLPERTKILLDRFLIQKPRFLSEFYLTGGTALSLLLGHRESEDLDFFAQFDFDPIELQIELEKYGSLNGAESARNTLNCELEGVKLQFLGYPYPLIAPQILYQDLRISSVLDIAFTKLQTVGMRGSKKDFVDLYVLFEKYPLTDLLDALTRKYTKTQYSLTHILKSLIYFEDAEEQPMPRLHRDIKWGEVKKRMIEIARGVRIT